MTKTLLKSLLGATCLSVAIVGTAAAGGFSRGNADTDIIYEDGNFNMRSSVTYVSPKREFSANPNPDLVGTDYADDYIVPSFAFKLNVLDNFRCAGTHVMNNGGSALYAAPTSSGKLIEKFDTYESALTCGVKFDIGRGSLWALGGGFMEKFDYGRTNVSPSLPSPAGPIELSNAFLDLRGQDYGYRVGLAYEIKEIALRAQLMYRSGTEYGADGSLTLPTGALLGAEAQRLGARAQVLGQQAAAAAAAGNLALAGQLKQQAMATGQAAQQTLGAAYAAAASDRRSALPAIGTGALPQSVELKLQSGVAPGWLAFGSIKWTDWSTTTQLIAAAPSIGLTQTNDYFWKDGWTVTAGVGHAFSDNVSGLMALTYDQGVGTGWDLSSDVWTLSAGALLKDKWGGELRLGGGVSYLTSAEETRYGPSATSFDKGFDSAVDAGWSVAGNIGYAIKW